MTPSQISHVTATGDITTRDAYLRSVVLTGGADAATITVRSGGSGGTIVLAVGAGAGETAAADLHDAFCGGGIHVTLDGGTTPDITVVYA